MKKTLLAVTVIAAFSPAAQAQVSIGGVIQVNAKDYKIGNSARTTSTELRIDDDYNSRFWLKGSEDLGGGNSAIFYIENRLNIDVGSTIGVGNGLSNGDSWVGLAGSWGQITAGKHSMMYVQGLPTELPRGGNNTALPNSMWGTFNILSFVANQGITTSRVANSVMYRSPNVGGFSGSIGVGASGSNGNEGQLPASAAGANPSDYSTGRQFYLQTNYSRGPIYLNLAYWNSNAEGRPVVVTAATADQREARLSGSYLFASGLKIGLQVDRAALLNVGRTGTYLVPGAPGSNMTRTAWEVPINYSFGPNTLLSSYTRAGNLSTAADSGAKCWTLGWDRALSPRTTVGVYYNKLSNDSAGVYQSFNAGSSANGSVMVAGESATTYAIGMKHVF
ncbi:MAG TPA: porin [Burkholderiaceae bacterium]